MDQPNDKLQSLDNFIKDASLLSSLYSSTHPTADMVMPSTVLSVKENLFLLKEELEKANVDGKMSEALWALNHLSRINANLENEIVDGHLYGKPTKQIKGMCEGKHMEDREVAAGAITLLHKAITNSRARYLENEIETLLTDKTETQPAKVLSHLEKLVNYSYFSESSALDTLKKQEITEKVADKLGMSDLIQDQPRPKERVKLMQEKLFSDAFMQDADKALADNQDFIKSKNGQKCLIGLHKKSTGEPEQEKLAQHITDKAAIVPPKTEPAIAPTKEKPALPPRKARAPAAPLRAEKDNDAASSDNNATSVLRRKITDMRDFQSDLDKRANDANPDHRPKLG